MVINRESIIKVLKDKFEGVDNVCAFWLEGSDAAGYVDQYSDIDIWFDIINGYEEKFIDELKSLLEDLSKIDFLYEKNHNHPEIRQIFIHLKDTSEYLILDICIQSHSREIAFTKENKDEVVKAIFDKDNVIKYTHLDLHKYKDEMKSRVQEISSIYQFQSILVYKEIKRANYLEALNYYNKIILQPLVELVGILNVPTKKDYGLKHIYRDLNDSLLEMLEYFHKICSLRDIERKTAEAVKYFYSLINDNSDL